MSYATAADFSARFPLREVLTLSNLDNPTATAPNDLVIETALADASSEIDSYLCQRFVTPISPVPAILVRLECDICRYRLDTNIQKPREDVKERYEAALAWLRQLASGAVCLGDSSLLLPTTAIDLPRAKYNTAVFSPANFVGF